MGMVVNVAICIMPDLPIKCALNLVDQIGKAANFRQLKLKLTIM
jgi:hypothetical protein